MGVVTLGAETFAFVDSPEKCPSGTWPKLVSMMHPTSPTGKIYECNKGEPWYCEMFGVGCKGIIPTAFPAPKTHEELTVPGAWTPEKVSGKWKEEENQNVREWLQSTSGVGEALPGEETIENLQMLGISTGIAFFVIGAVGLLILIKR